jgi:hypothetical protein
MGELKETLALVEQRKRDAPDPERKERDRYMSRCAGNRR